MNLRGHVGVLEVRQQLRMFDAPVSFAVVKRPHGQSLTNAYQEIRLSDAIASAYFSIDEDEGSLPLRSEQSVDFTPDYMEPVEDFL